MALKRSLKTQVPAIIIDSTNDSVKTVSKIFTAIPYYAWANRGKGEMMSLVSAACKSDIDIIAIFNI